MDVYQSMIRTLRCLNIRGGGGWPGKELNASAVSRYPNIAAEILASSGYLWCPAEHAGVSKDILAAVLEDREDLTLGELFGLCRLFGCRASYLSAPTLQTVDPATNKGKARLRQLSDLLAQVNKLECYPLWMIGRTRNALERGEVVTFAAWRRGCQEIRWELGREKSKERRSNRIERGLTA